MMKKTKKTKNRTLLIFLVIVAVLFAGMGIYVSDYYHADALAQETLAEGIKTGSMVQEKGMISFPAGEDTKEDIGLIFYPGGKVEYLAYVPLLQKLQNRGISCYLVQMPFNLAMFGSEKAANIIRNHPEIEHWYLAGHSLGGAFASKYASDHEEQIEGVILLGAYVYGGYPIEQTITIYGSEDQILNRKKVDYDTNVHVLEGGNHGAFGNYGRQKGDGELQISSEEQQEKTVDLIMNFIK